MTTGRYTRISKMAVLQVVITLMTMGLVSSQMEMKSDSSGKTGTLNFKAPDLSDEESHSPFMPDLLKCDSCKAIAHQLYTHFNDFNVKNKKLKYNIPESEIIDIIEQVCDRKTWDSYGLKNAGGVNRISGPGTDAVDTPGIMTGGGKWPGRMMDMCEQYAGELGEDELYKAYKKNPKRADLFTQYLCKGSGIRGDCSKIKDEL